MQSIRILDVRIDVLDYDDLNRYVDNILSSKASRTTQPCVITAPHYYILLLAARTPWLADLLERSSINYIDGIGTLYAARMLGANGAPRINGTDFHEQVLDRVLRAGYRVALLGGNRTTCQMLDEKIHANYPASDILVHHGYFDIADKSVPEMINRFRPDLLFLGLGTPRQFEWIREHCESLHVPVIFATGAFLDFLAGTRPRAPRWMRRAGLEWLHRLLLEPGRLWRRYLLGIPRFLALVLRQRLRGES